MATEEDLLPLSDDELPVRHRRRGRRVLIATLGLLLGLVLLVAGTAFVVVQRVGGSVERIPSVFESMPEAQRPAVPAEGEAGRGAVNILLAGLDRRSDAATTGTDAEIDAWKPGAARTDAVMLLHLTADGEAAYLVSIPRDTWVPIPGFGMNKINAAFSFGGPSLYVETLETLTGLRMDHLAIIDWNGFTKLTDALGGVTLTFDEEIVARGRTFPPGTHTLSGAEALDYVGERYNAPGGDFGRIQRQQNWLRAMLRQTLSSDTLTDPGQLADVIGAITQTTSVDDELSNTELVGLALSARGLRSDDVRFVTVPNLGTGTAGAASIVRYDEELASSMWDAVRRDDLPGWLAQHDAQTLGESVG